MSELVKIQSDKNSNKKNQVILEEKVTIPEQEVMKLYCRRCGNIWYYRGHRKYVVTCSKCHTTLTITPKRGQN
ncbi:MAG TPA: hypothetical protein VJ729_16515 [Nitrososphaeraceae archaeon]|nr:hypothetical protein [Nitrososphaeraceae archaeon]